MKITLGILWTMVLLSGPVRAQTEAVPPSSRFSQLAVILTAAPAPLPADFARTALQEMIRAYTEEAELARRDRRALKRNPGLPGWARTVESYAHHLHGVAAGLENEAGAAVTLGPTGQVILFLDSGPVVVSGPRISEPLVLEERILARFCTLHPCDALLAMHQPVQARPMPPPRRRTLPVAVSWRFDAHDGPVCRGDGGLELQFRNSRNLVDKRRLCTRVVRELNALAVALGDYRAKGVNIQWDTLRVKPLSGEVVDLVRLNRDGDQLLLMLPTLAAAPEIVDSARDWLAARSRAESGSWVLRDAGRFLAATGL